MKIKELKKYWICLSADLFEVDGERVLSLDPFDDQPVIDFDVIQVIDPNQSFGAYEELKYLKMVKIWSNEGLRLKSLSE